MKEPVDHIFRPQLPWRPGPTLTECGYDASKVDALGQSRELSLAKTKVEEAVMWAVKQDQYCSCGAAKRAIAEIEWLQRDISRLCTIRSNLEAAADQHDRERDRLRAALERIEQLAVNRPQGHIRVASNIAREALRGADETTGNRPQPNSPQAEDSGGGAGAVTSCNHQYPLGADPSTPCIHCGEPLF